MIDAADGDLDHGRAAPFVAGDVQVADGLVGDEAVADVNHPVRAVPAQAGDADGSIMLFNSANVPGFARITSIPVTLRSLVPSLSTTFTGTLTGGNGRELSTGQTAYYQVAVPVGTSALNVSSNATINSTPRGRHTPTTDSGPTPSPPK